MLISPALVLLLIPPHDATAVRVVADARQVSLGIVAERRTDLLGPLYEIDRLDREVRRRWREPDGPGDRLALLALAHAATAETRLELSIGRDELDLLKRTHEYAHAAGARPSRAGAPEAEPFLRGLRTHRPRLAASLDRVPAVRRVLLAALFAARPPRPVRAGGAVRGRRFGR